MMVKESDLIKSLITNLMVNDCSEDHDTLWQYDGKDKLDVEHDRYTGNWKGVITGTEYTAKEDMTLPYDVILKVVISSKQVILSKLEQAITLSLSLTKILMMISLIKLLRLLGMSKKLNGLIALTKISFVH
ncbi:hypothetical protein [Streptococcus macedonicus]|uniref:hypothetical protein n=1 Tax=Streptococcus macedonicus TaxID=59310 RepID=UPI0039E19A07